MVAEAAGLVIYKKLLFVWNPGIAASRPKSFVRSPELRQDEPRQVKRCTKILLWALVVFLSNAVELRKSLGWLNTDTKATA